MGPRSAIARIVCIAVAAAACAASGAAADAPGAGLVLVRDGQAAAAIVIAATPTDNARLGAAELQRYLEKMTGAKLPIAADDVPPPGPLVLVGGSALTDRLPGLEIPAGRSKRLREEGFIIRTEGDRLVLAGNDAEPYYGTRYAVAEFLHRLGVRWFLPGEIGEVVPRRATVAVGPMRVLERPDFPVRTFWEHSRGDMAKECEEWKIRNKMNPRATDAAFGVPGDSSVRNYLPGDRFAAHPDWFALGRDGARIATHPCTTSEGMIRHFVERVSADARAGKRFSAFAPDDGLPRCWCERCAAIGNGFDGYGGNTRDPVPDSSASNEWFYFVNRILNEVNREFPEHMIATNGYANRDIPPEMPPDVAFNPRGNLTVMFANICACTIHAYDEPKCWQMERQGRMIRQWCALTDKLWIYNYNYTMLVNKGTLTPMVHRLRRNIPLLKQWGVLGFHDQDEADWSLTGLTTRIVRARLEWNVNAGVDAILDDFHAAWFGRAAAPMKAYYEALEDAFEKAPQHGHEDVILPAIYGEELMARLDASMRAAEAAAQSEAERLHMRIERLIYDNLREFVAAEKAKRECDFTAAAAHTGRQIELQAELNRITPFMGWHPYPAYGIDWEKKRMEDAAAKLGGPEGELVALLPEAARFRTDPFDDGRYERWQDPQADLSQWETIATTSGWDTQGRHDAKGRPYTGAAWYQFDVGIPASAEGKDLRLYGMGVVNEAWVWVDGRYAGHRPYIQPWFRPHTLELNVRKLLAPGRTNRITVRVLCNSDVWGANGIYERLFVYAKKPGGATPDEGR